MNYNSTTLLAEATANHMAGQFEQAEKKYRMILSGPDASAVVHNNLAFLLSQRGMFEASVTEYRKAIELSPDYSTAYTNLGQTLIHLEKYEAAGTALQKAVQLDPDDFHANKGMAKLCMLGEAMPEAEAYLKKSYALRSDGDVLLELAWCLMSQGKLEEASSVLGYAEDAVKNNARYHSLWGMLHFHFNNFGQAAYCFRQSLGLEPENTETRNHLVLCLLKTGDTAEAFREMHRILLMDPGHVDTLNNLAVLELATGNTGAASKHLDIVLEQDPENGKAMFYKALVCIQKEKKEEAIVLLKHVESNRDPNYSEKAHEAIELLIATDKSSGS
jgi:Flp pilus assembly protein TadD